MRLVLERVILPVHRSLGNGGLRCGSVQRVWSRLVHKLRDGPLLSCWSNVLWGVSRRDLRGCDGGLIVLVLSCRFFVWYRKQRTSFMFLREVLCCRCLGVF